MNCNLYFGRISGVENRVSFQNNVRYSEVVAKRGSAVHNKFIYTVSLEAPHKWGGPWPPCLPLTSPSRTLAYLLASPGLPIRCKCTFNVLKQKIITVQLSDKSI